MSSIASKNREFVKEYLSIIKRPGRLDEASEKVLEELTEKVHTLYSSKDILLDGPGDRRIGCIFSSMKSRNDRGRTGSISVFSGPPRGKLRLPQSMSNPSDG